MPLKKSYILPPSFDCPVDGPVFVGAILADPKKPFEPLNDAKWTTVGSFEKLHSTEKTDWTANDNRTTKLEASIFAQILAPLTGIGGDFGSRFSKSDLMGLKCRRLVTEWFIPTPAYLEESLRQSDLLEAIKRRRGPTLYLVCGRKLAYGLSADHVLSNGRGYSATLALDGTSLGIPVQTGPKISVDTDKSFTESFQGSSDIVLAYQLRRIFYSAQHGLSSKEYERHASLTLPDKIKDDEEEDEDDEESETSDGGEWTGDTTIGVDGIGGDDIGSSYFGKGAVVMSDDEDGTEWELISSTL